MCSSLVAGFPLFGPPLLPAAIVVVVVVVIVIVVVVVVVRSRPLTISNCT